MKIDALPARPLQGLVRQKSQYCFGGCEGSDVKAVAACILEWAVNDSRLRELQELMDELKAQIEEKYTPRISDYDNEK